MMITRTKDGFVVDGIGCISYPAKVTVEDIDTLLDLCEPNRGYVSLVTLRRIDSILEETYGNGVFPGGNGASVDKNIRCRGRKVTLRDCIRGLIDDCNLDEAAWSTVPDFMLIWADNEVRDILRDEVACSDIWADAKIAVDARAAWDKVVDRLLKAIEKSGIKLFCAEGVAS